MVNSSFSLAAIVYLLFQLYLFLLIARIVLDYVRLFARGWQPRGIVLVIAETIYTVTDPPLRFVRRFIPPLNFGGMSIDLSFLIVFFAISMLMRTIPALLL